MNSDDRSTTDAPVRRVAVVVNLKSGSSDIDLDTVVERMRGDSTEIVSVSSTSDPSELGDLARDAVRDADVIAVGGGDGTMSGLLSVIKDAGRTLGVLPLGTANDLARSLGIPLDPLQAAEIIRTGVNRRIDLGEVNGRLFCNAISLGFPVELADQQDPARKKWLGMFDYPLLWLDADRNYEPLDVTLHHDGNDQHFRSIFMLTVMNGRYHGGGLAVDEDSRIDDGLLKVYCLRDMNKWKVLRALARLKRGRLYRNADTVVVRAREVTLTSDDTVPLNVDGDIGAETPATISVLPGALTVLGPA